jgi:NADPH:quinone reductase-like Zn-dependent oxidoreductase
MVENLNLGETYKVLELIKFGGELTLVDRKFRELQPKEILVKVICATIHPADMMKIQGIYGGDPQPNLPIIPGIEGSGIIVQVGNEIDSNLVGKRVGVLGSNTSDGSFEGLWGQYIYTTYSRLVIFNKEVDYELICFSFVNPFTAVGFLDTLKKKGVTSVGQNGASSAFGKMFIRLCHQEGIKTVNVVRKEEHFETLKSLGADFVLNSTSTDFEENLKQTLKENNVQNFFECVGGSTTGTTLKLLPIGSTLYHYGNLELTPASNIDSKSLIFEKKTLTGFWVSDWLRSIKPEEFGYWAKYVVTDFESDSGLFKTSYSKNFSLGEFKDAFEFYLKDMSGGKVILRPNGN